MANRGGDCQWRGRTEEVEALGAGGWYTHPPATGLRKAPFEAFGAAEQLLPLVYEELRQLAARRLAQEQPGQTLQATALVHEAYLRLVDVEPAQRWNGRGHFFAAAAEAMR